MLMALVLKEEMNKQEGKYFKSKDTLANLIFTSLEFFFFLIYKRNTGFIGIKTWQGTGFTSARTQFILYFLYIIIIILGTKFDYKISYNLRI